MYAAVGGSIVVVNILLENGADIKTKNNDG